ncbi:MAG: hypothetical protein EBS91_02985 [Betaproteobacteria bacterium]|nr:hypothetical protein [Betaproteobacteria bacterium]
MHQTVYNKVGNMTSIGAMSTSWPWPYPPVTLAYPGSQMNRHDPGNEVDGMGTLAVSVKAGGQKLAEYQPFGDSLTPYLKKGLKA